MPCCTEDDKPPPLVRGDGSTIIPGDEAARAAGISAAQALPGLGSPPIAAATVTPPMTSAPVGAAIVVPTTSARVASHLVPRMSSASVLPRTNLPGVASAGVVAATPLPGMSARIVASRPGMSARIVASPASPGMASTRGGTGSTASPRTVSVRLVDLWVDLQLPGMPAAIGAPPTLPGMSARIGAPPALPGMSSRMDGAPAASGMASTRGSTESAALPQTLSARLADQRTALLTDDPLLSDAEILSDMIDARAVYVDSFMASPTTQGCGGQSELSWRIIKNPDAPWPAGRSDLVDKLDGVAFQLVFAGSPYPIDPSALIGSRVVDVWYNPASPTDTPRLVADAVITATYRSARPQRIGPIAEVNLVLCALFEANKEMITDAFSRDDVVNFIHDYTQGKDFTVSLQDPGYEFSIDESGINVKLSLTGSKTLDVDIDIDYGPRIPPFSVTIDADITIEVAWEVFALDCLLNLHMYHFLVDVDIDLPWYLDVLENTPFIGPIIRAVVMWAKDHYVVDPIYCELLPALTSEIQSDINDAIIGPRGLQPGACVCRAGTAVINTKPEIWPIACPTH